MTQAPNTGPTESRHARLLVIGGGPGGYTAAFRAADLGLDVVLVDQRDTLGGVCLNVGCIPSKTLLHAAKVLEDARALAEHGLPVSSARPDLPKLRSWKDGVVARLTGGLAGLAKQRRIMRLTGEARFTGPHEALITSAGRDIRLTFDQAVVAVGSRPTTLPFLPADEPRILDSTGALALASIPERLLILGGGIIGLEMATVYQALGSRVTIVEAQDQLIPGADRDLVAPLHKHLVGRYEKILLECRITAVRADAAGLVATIEAAGGRIDLACDALLVAVGRRPNGTAVNAEAAGVAVDAAGFIPVDRRMRSNVGHIFAVGDVTGQPMLAHKATHEGKVAAEVAAGDVHAGFDARVIPSVAYTDPEIAWVGLTETAAAAQGIAVGKGVFPWAASGRSLSLGRDEGLTKLLFDPQSRRLLGAGMVGPSAGELVAEVALAIEMGADAADLGLTIHPHPTLSETIGMAAEAFEGTLTDLIAPKRR
jgi:dihydrolipoamide dehydrogenase